MNLDKLLILYVFKRLFEAINNSDSARLHGNNGAALQARPPFIPVIARIERLHIRLIRESLKGHAQLAAETEEEIFVECNQLRDFLSSTRVIGEMTDRSREIVIGSGHRMAGLILTAYLKTIGLYVKFININHDGSSFGQESDQKDHHMSCIQLAEIIHQQTNSHIPIVNAYMSNLLTEKGIEYADFSAALVASAIGASRLCFWSNAIDGFYSGNPKIISKANHYDHLDGSMALSLTRLAGSQDYSRAIIHPDALEWIMSQQQLSGHCIQVEIYRRSSSSSTGQPTKSTKIHFSTSTWPFSPCIRPSLTNRFIVVKRDVLHIRIKKAALINNYNGLPQTGTSEAASSPSSNPANNSSQYIPSTIIQLSNILKRFNFTSDMMAVSGEGCVSMACLSSTSNQQAEEVALNAMRKLGLVEFSSDRSIISFLVQAPTSQTQHLFSNILDHLTRRNVNVEMIAHGASSHECSTMSLCVDSNDAGPDCIQFLHDVLMNS